MADWEAEEIAGGGTDRLRVIGGGSFSENDAAATEGGGITDDGAEVPGVGDFRKDDEGSGSFNEVVKSGVCWFTGDGEVAAMEVKAEKGGGFCSGEIGPDVQFFLDEVGGFLETGDGELPFDDKVGRGFAVFEVGFPVHGLRAAVC